MCNLQKRICRLVLQRWPFRKRLSVDAGRSDGARCLLNGLIAQDVEPLLCSSRWPSVWPAMTSVWQLCCLRDSLSRSNMAHDRWRPLKQLDFIRSRLTVQNHCKGLHHNYFDLPFTGIVWVFVNFLLKWCLEFLLNNYFYSSFLTLLLL